MLRNRQDYIKAIYELGGEVNRISTKDIASSLNISPPSVSEMIKKLLKEDLIEYKTYRGVKLTKSGLEEARGIKRKHILWEVFLVEKLGYSWEDVHEEAEILEHVTSSKLEARLERYLDYPKTCPHGTPIEQGNYLFDFTPLADGTIGESLTIKRLEDDKDLLKHVRILGLNLEDTIEIVARDREIGRAHV